MNLRENRRPSRLFFVVEWKLYRAGNPRSRDAFFFPCLRLWFIPFLGGRSGRILGQMTLIVKLTNFWLQILARLLSSPCRGVSSNGVVK